MRWIFCLIFALAFASISAQGVRWKPGTVVLQSNEVLNGEVCFQTAGLLLFRVDDDLRVFTPAHLQSFRFFDPEENVHHRFTRQPDENGVLRFFEVVLTGAVQVLRLFTSDLPLQRPVSDRNDFAYYVYFNGEGVRLHHFRKHVFPVLTARDPELPALVRARSLRPHDAADAIRIAELFNQRHRQQGLLAARQL